MKEYRHWMTTVFLAALLALVAINQYMLLSIGSVPRVLVATGQASAEKQQTSQPIMEAEPSTVGIPYNEQGYKQLLGYDNAIQLDAAEKSNYVGLNIALPCCGFQALQAEGNCQCGHHVAMSGLAKYMIQKGYDIAEVQAELDKWKEVFYPGSSNGGGLGGC